MAPCRATCSDRDDQIQVEVDGVAESLAARTRSVRIVEGEEPGLGFLVKCPSFLHSNRSLNVSRSAGFPHRPRQFENGFALPFAIANFDGVNEPRRATPD